jgi:MFS family permease
MVDQATVKRGNPAAKLGRNVSGYAHDLLTLGELQLRLFAVDVRDGSKTAGLGLGAIAAGLFAAIGAIPLIFVTIAVALVEFADWSWTAGFGVSALLGLVFGGVAAWFGWKRLLSAGKTFGRSKAEAVETMRWIKESLRPTEPDPIPGPVRRF